MFLGIFDFLGVISKSLVNKEKSLEWMQLPDLALCIYLTLKDEGNNVDPCYFSEALLFL